MLLHPTTLVSEGQLNTSFTTPPQLPLEMILPRTQDVTNLTVGICLSTTHVALAGLRYELIFAQLGEASAVVAALAIKNNVPVQNVLYSDVLARLNNVGALVT